MQFVIDETSWDFDKLTPDECVEAIETILDRIDDATEQGYSVCYSEDLFHTTVYKNRCFYDLYAIDSPLPIPREVQERVSSLFGKLPKWQDLSCPWPSSFEIKIKGTEEEAPSIAWAHKQSMTSSTNPVGCIIIPTIRESGLFAIEVDEEKYSIWLIATNQDYVNYFRWVICTATTQPKQIETYTISAFPNIDFVPNSFNGIKKMSKPYINLVENLVLHLGVLSDHGQRIFSGAWDNATAEFGACGTDVTDENGKTKANKKAKDERTIILNGEQRTFWWHSKLEADRDRIHFCPQKVNENGNILVGIFCRHLFVP